MQSKAVFILCVLLTAQVFAVRDVSGVSYRALKADAGSGGSGGASTGGSSVGVTIGSSASSNSPDGSASSSAAVSATVVGQGALNAFVNARAISLAVQRSVFIRATAEAISEVKGGGNALSIARIEANAYALAVAQALSETVIDIESNGEGATACAIAVADADATARAVAEVFVEVLAEASNDINFASASFAISAIIDATVDAYSNAQSQACGSGIFQANTYISVLSTALAKPFIEVALLAFALVTPNASVAEILVSARADTVQVTTVDGRSATTVFGNARAASLGGGNANANGRR